MILKRLTLFIFILLCVSISNLHAQEVIVTSGGNAEGSGGSSSYSVGQVFFSVYTGTNGSIVEGVQQAYEISTHTGIELNEDINLQCSTFPNPTNDFLILKIEKLDLSSLSFQLYDMQGKLLEDKKPEGNETKISMLNYSPSVYFLKVKDSQKELITFKIIKN